MQICINFAANWLALIHSWCQKYSFKGYELEDAKKVNKEVYRFYLLCVHVKETMNDPLKKWTLLLCHLFVDLSSVIGILVAMLFLDWVLAGKYLFLGVSLLKQQFGASANNNEVGDLNYVNCLDTPISQLYLPCSLFFALDLPVALQMFNHAHVPF